ncbi:glucosamine-6-phosphate deaminase [Proteinivorax hydrogeniformans]|uniref:Glucosamine-6-phosphate deaminase n=1 Tax=Proteinivorax hydrogeniformans TaxID=1826727 RepID=A0AAU8HW43_9FIRM
MRIIIEKDYNSLSKTASLLVASQTVLKPDSVLGLATGSTPLGMYNNLIEMYKRKEVDFSKVTTFNLDEYYGLSANHPQSYNTYMRENFFDHINIPPSQFYLPKGDTENVTSECYKYEEKIAQAGGIDFQVLGIGENGHIGFNEPDESLNVQTNLVDLTPQTIQANSRFFDSFEEVPKQAISIGIATIMKAKKILLLASGENKAEAIAQMTSGYVTTKVPASLLQTHQDVILLVDEKAGKLLR